MAPCFVTRSCPPEGNRMVPAHPEMLLSPCLSNLRAGNAMIDLAASIRCLTIAFLAVVYWSVAPSAAYDSDKGRELAERLCAVCHLNEGQGENHGPSGVPGFHAIANRPHQTHDAIVRWLRSKPGMMPDHHLSWDEADSLAAFIMSLRKSE